MVSYELSLTSFIHPITISTDVMDDKQKTQRELFHCNATVP